MRVYIIYETRCVKIDFDTISLPSMPMVAQKILSLNMDIDRDQDALAPAICQCSVTSARIISIANSAAFGAPSGLAISSVKEAVQRIGMTNTYNAALASALFTIQSQDNNHGFDCNKIWKHSAEVRQVMQVFAKRMRSFERPSLQEIALTALLHDIGFLAYNAINPELTDTVIDRLKKGEDSHRVTQELFGITHDKLGAALLSSWGIPKNIVTAVEWHHHNDLNRPCDATFSLGILLSIAEACLMNSPHTYDSCHEELTPEKAACLLHINYDDLQAEIENLKDEGLTISL